MQAKCVLAIALLLLSVNAAAKEIPQTKAQREGFSQQRLERLSSVMQQQVADGTMVGGMGLIARHGKVVYSQTYGLADREAGVAMREDTIHRIYSMTKPITAVALMMLYEEGRFFLNDPLAEYLPELANLQVARSTADAASTQAGGSDGIRSATAAAQQDSVELQGVTRPAQRQPTIRDLLTHTAGFTYGVFGRTEVDQAYMRAQLLNPRSNLQEFVAQLGKLPLQYDPGSRWHYSVAVDVQGRLVEALSGMSFADFLQTRIFAPLDMRDTSFFIQPAKAQRLATIYVPEGVTAQNFLAAPTGKGLVPAPALVDAGYQPDARFASGGGGLLSTARDYLRFSQMILNGGELHGVRLLSRKTVELMAGNHLGDITHTLNSPGGGFGLGFGVVLDPAAGGRIGSAGELSWGGAAGTRFWIDPVEQLIGIFLVQSIPHHTRLAHQFKVLTYQALAD